MTVDIETPIVFSLIDKVRDSEVDKHNGVANFTYLSMLQHARHEYLIAAGVDVEHFIPVVTDAHIKYKNFLTSQDRYETTIRVERQRLAYIFRSDITNLKTGKIAVTSELQVVFFTPDKKAVRSDIPGIGTVIAPTVSTVG